MDGIPVALMEAMLKGVPVISTDLSGIPELVIHHETGLCANNNDIEHLANILLQAIHETPEEMAIRVKKAQDLVIKEYDLHRNAERLATLLNIHIHSL